MRFIGLDVTRSVAIFLAMSSHVYVEFGVGEFVPGDLARYYRFIAQIAPVTFIMLFGAMLQIVYYPRWAAGRKTEVASRLLLRAAQCYVLYGASIFVLFLIDDGYSAAFSISCLLFMGNSPYTEILKFYAVALALAPVLLWAVGRIGLLPLVATSVLFNAAWPLLNALPDAYTDLGVHLQISRSIKFFTGFGSRPIAGPSVLHGLTLIIAGMCLGKFLTRHVPQKQADQKTPPNLVGFAMIVRRSLLLGAVSVALLVSLLPAGTIAAVANMTLRMESNSLYFVVGVAFTVLASLFFVWLVDVKTRTQESKWQFWSFFGRTSLFTFSWGNILLYLITYKPDTAAGVYMAASLTLLAICFMSFAFDFLMQRPTKFRNWVQIANRPLERLTRARAKPTAA